MVNVVNLSQFQNINLEIKYKDGKQIESVVIPKVSSRFTFMLKSNREIMHDIVLMYQNSLSGEDGNVDIEAFNFALFGLLGKHFDFIINIISQMLIYYIGPQCNFKWVDENTSDESKIQLLTALIQSTTTVNQNQKFGESVKKATRGKKKAVLPSSETIT